MSMLEEKRLAEIAVNEGLAAKDQIIEAQTAIDEAASQGQSKTILDVLLEKKVIDQEQKNQIIKKAEAAGPIKLGDFEIISLLGAGGMGAVYKAKEISLDRLCALKLLPSHFAKEPSIVARFRREAQACARLDHPNIIRGYRVGEVDGQHFFAMELVEGASVSDIIEQSGPMPIDQVVKIYREITSALMYAHANGMIHRDIKPDNIMINCDGVAKLADLGLVKASDEGNTRLTASGTGMGTPAYMPLEQARGAKNVDARSDLYSLGASMYHMVTGRMPYEGASAFEVYQLAERGVLKSPRSIRGETPSWLDLVICKLMQRKPENRFQSSEELLQIIDRNASVSTAADAFVTGAPKAPSAPKAPTPPSRLWHLRIKQEDGSIKKARAETRVLRQLVKAGKISINTMARQGEEGPFRPLSEYRGLLDSPQTPKPGQAKDRHGAMKSFYDQLETASRKRKRMKKIKRIVIRVLIAVAILILVIIALSYRAEIAEWIKGIF